MDTSVLRVLPSQSSQDGHQRLLGPSFLPLIRWTSTSSSCFFHNPHQLDISIFWVLPSSPSSAGHQRPPGPSFLSLIRYTNISIITNNWKYLVALVFHSLALVPMAHDRGEPKHAALKTNKTESFPVASSFIFALRIRLERLNPIRQILYHRMEMTDMSNQAYNRTFQSSSTLPLLGSASNR